MLIHDSRSALSKARFFLEKAASAAPNQRVEFEAYLEAAIVFGRAAVHRFKTLHRGHPDWKSWWDSLLRDETMVFFRDERNWILKEGPPKFGQKIWMPSIGPGGEHIPAEPVASAAALYYFTDPAIPATTTVERHVLELERLLQEAEARFD